MREHLGTVTRCEMIASKLSLLIQNMNKSKSIFQPFSSEYVIQKQYKNHPHVPIRQSLDVSNVAGPLANKCKTAQYVSITQTLTSRFKDKRFLTDHGKKTFNRIRRNLYPLPGWKKIQGEGKKSCRHGRIYR